MLIPLLKRFFVLSFRPCRSVGLLKLILGLLWLNLATLPLFASPEKIISGNVSDTKGQPLVGVSVVIKGSTKGTTTDTKGNFSLNSEEGQTLTFSYIGYISKEMKVGATSTFTIILEEDTKYLSEVLVVGYGTQKKVNLTGAVDQIGGEVLENRPITRISQALQGAAGNLNVTTNTSGGAPNATQSINIRGFTGFGTTGSPLVVIDGVQGGDINSLNPNDIENISILKDAASSAIYGSSAPYGVILITTKQGKKGGKPSISYNNNFSMAQPINLPQMINSLDFAKLYNEAFVNAGRAEVFNPETLERIKAYQAGTITNETIANPTPGSNGWNTWAASNANNDWFKIYFRDFAPSQQHNISVNGGSEGSTYYVGLGYNQRAVYHPEIA
ncbi:TonB-dependent receptor plug domain-containing protein [Runella sp. MFBS21]|uniref:TonB-dependent receptor plug domain-containing protein n=1 Tax=Runella sp. MFBS21 TaxID=3034018 RepID=UPI0023F922B7|nr:TonB-dependent receptor plug domain-containing protein [Runella sp. MFBS21]